VGVKPYYLLKKALERTGKVAIGKIALRDREHLCRLALHERGLVLNTLHWPDEIRDAGELKLPEEEVSVHERELDMAVMLIDNLAASFDPSRYRDEYREALLRVVEAKLGDQKVDRPEPAEGMPAMDLMAALKASVEEAKRRAPAVEAVGVATGRTASAARRQREAPPASGATAEPSRRRRRVS
jgi:DNA end-binding protein Ku